jgi:hypothetical protein
MKLTDEQVQAIVDDIVSKMEAIIEDPCDGDYSDFECYEDEYGHCYNFGSHSIESELEEIGIDGLPGIPADDSDICISADYTVDIDFHDDYDPDEEALLWLGPDGHGMNGAPYRMTDVVKDMEQCETFIGELLELLIEANSNECLYALEDEDEE